MEKNYYDFIDKMRDTLRTKEYLIECLSVCRNQRSWYMDAKLNDDGELVYDDNGNTIKVAPEKDNAYNWYPYVAWTMVIESIEKLIEK